MALARIITRSNPCSRQLALDLLDRGYAVEIVSPDSVPDNLADLELRVEEDPGNQLVASVEAHNGEHTASLEFLHYLKAPMPDFVRRPPAEAHEAVHSPEPPVSFNAEQSAEEMKLLADAPQLTLIAGSQTVNILDDSRLNPELDPKPASVERARLTLPPDPLPSSLLDPPSHVAVEVPTMARPMLAQQMLAKLAIVKLGIAKLAIARAAREWRYFPAGWSTQRIALTVVSAVLLTLVLLFGMRRTGKASAAQNSATASSDLNLLSATSPKKVAGNPVAPPVIKSDANFSHAPSHTPNESQVAKAGTAGAGAAAVAAAGSGAVVPRRHSDGLIARDTVTYLDKPNFDSAVSKATTTSGQFATPQPNSRKSDGVIAANTVTLNDKPSPKAAKRDSSIKRYSDLK